MNEFVGGRVVSGRTEARRARELLRRRRQRFDTQAEGHAKESKDAE